MLHRRWRSDYRQRFDANTIDEARTQPFPMPLVYSYPFPISEMWSRMSVPYIFSSRWVLRGGHAVKILDALNIRRRKKNRCRTEGAVGKGQEGP